MDAMIDRLLLGIPRHSNAFLLALVAGTLCVAPALYFAISVPAYQGIQMIGSDAEEHYAARIAEVYDDHSEAGNVFLSQKDLPYLTPALGEHMVASEKIDVPTSGYFSFVGTTKERKNLLNLLRAFVLAKKRNTLPHHLLIAGRNNIESQYGKCIAQVIKESGFANEITFTGRVTEGQLAFLYRNAVAFAFPSLFEGFGMPVVEAMLLGTPVLTSKIGSLPEAAGDAALLVDPYSVDEIPTALTVLVHNENLRESLIEKGHARAHDFSWKSSAKKIIELMT